MKLVSWLVDLERTDTRYLEEDLVVTAQAFADHIGLVLELPTAGVELSAAENLTSTHTPLDRSDSASTDATDHLAVAEGNFDGQTPGRPEVNPQAMVDARDQIARVRMLTELLPTFWSAAGWQTDEPWRWQYTVDRRRLRPYRRLHSLEDLIEYTNSVEQEAQAATAALRGCYVSF